MKTLGINMTHDASVCQCDDGDITTFLEEERLTGICLLYTSDAADE